MLEGLESIPWSELNHILRRGGRSTDLEGPVASAAADRASYNGNSQFCRKFKRFVVATPLDEATHVLTMLAESLVVSSAGSGIMGEGRKSFYEVPKYERTR